MKLSNFLRRSRSEKGLFFLAYAGLGLARFLIVIVPFKFISRWIGELESIDAADLPLDQVTRERAEKVGWAVSRAASLTPWKSNCLPQAIVARWLLSTVGVSSSVYFGARIDDNSMAAHAWVKSGNTIVVGGEGHEEFAVTARYVAHRLERATTKEHCF